MSGFSAFNWNFLSFTSYHTCSTPQGTPVLGWGFSVAVKSCLDGLPASLDSWKLGCTECRIGLLGCGAGLGRSCFSRWGLSCAVQVSRAAHPFPALLGLGGSGRSALLPHSTEPCVQLHELLALRSCKSNAKLAREDVSVEDLSKKTF